MHYHGLRMALAGALVGLLPTSGEAAVKFCNNYSRTVFVAVAYEKTPGSWFARGWLSVAPGACSEFNDPPLHVPTFMYRAETDTYSEGRRRVRQTWGDNGKLSFAVQDKGFSWDNAGSLVGKPGAHLAGFSDTGTRATGGDLSITLTFKEGTTTLTTGPNQ